MRRTTFQAGEVKTCPLVCASPSNRRAPRHAVAQNCPLKPSPNVQSCNSMQGASQMSEFLFIFRGSTRQGRSPEELQKSMQKWVAWFKELNEKGIIKDPGNPLEAS